MRSYSSAVSPWSRRTSGVMARVAVDMRGSSIVAFSGEIQKHLPQPTQKRLTAVIAEVLTQRTLRNPARYGFLSVLGVLGG